MEESTIRFTVFLSLIFILGVAQKLFPRRKLSQSQPKRWLTNFSLVILDSLIVRLTLGLLLPVIVANWAQEQNIGLFNIANMPYALAAVISVFCLDALIYWQHRIFHRIPILWRLHRVHHYDADYDLSTALRFHPIEIILSVMVKNTAIILLGAPAAAVILFEIILNGMALFNHANLALPEKADRILRRFVVTPDMHRVHHSVYSDEMHSNFGFNLSIWDRLFSSYVPQPKDGHKKMRIGQPDAGKLPTNSLVWLLGPALKQPLKK
ncbi:sterol desaturase family protein [Oceanospirillum sp.]|uniref:sterol desaturase family protein n=1 Tax=Oceanospirillum sp. TaxID=2021254 RepID=UPI003A91C66E